MQPVLLHPHHLTRFPDPTQYDAEGLVAVGGDLSPERLLLAYEHGIFPWYNDRYPPLWWSPNPRAVIPMGAVHVSRSMRRTLRKHDFEVSWNRAFSRVIACCGSARSEGTWILPEVIEAYELLHLQGYAHSLEVWQNDKLVGGLYGVQCGGLFAAESMFHRATDMSKVALIHAVTALARAGIVLFDVQFLTPHLRSLGAIEIPRAEYLSQLRRAVNLHVDLRGLPLDVPLDAAS